MFQYLMQSFDGKNDGKIINLKNKDKFNYDEIFCSPLLRSIQTAKKFRSKKIIIKNVLNEINYGDVEGLNIKQLKHLYPKMIKDWSLKKDPKLAEIIKQVGEFNVKITKNRYQSLVEAIIAQQLSGSAAESILKKFKF